MKKRVLVTLMVTIFTLSMLLTGCGKKNEQEEEKSLESSEITFMIPEWGVPSQEMLDEFNKETGIKVNVIEGKAPELLERLKREGKDTQADVFLTSDIANLYQAVDSGLTQNIESKIVEKNIPQNLRGENNEWVGLTKRARIIAYDKEKVKLDLFNNQNLSAPVSAYGQPEKSREAAGKEEN